jgi:hypothetical protein
MEEAESSTQDVRWILRKDPSETDRVECGRPDRMN